MTSTITKRINKGHYAITHKDTKRVFVALNHYRSWELSENGATIGNYPLLNDCKIAICELIQNETNAITIRNSIERAKLRLTAKRESARDEKFQAEQKFQNMLHKENRTIVLGYSTPMLGNILVSKNMPLNQRNKLISNLSNESCIRARVERAKLFSMRESMLELLDNPESEESPKQESPKKRKKINTPSRRTTYTYQAKLGRKKLDLHATLCTKCTASKRKDTKRNECGHTGMKQFSSIVKALIQHNVSLSNKQQVKLQKLITTAKKNGESKVSINHKGKTLTIEIIKIDNR